jgi:hypothetical protein
MFYVCIIKIAAIRPHFIVQGAVKAWIIVNVHEIVITEFQKLFHGFSDLLCQTLLTIFFNLLSRFSVSIVKKALILGFG